MKNKQYIIPAVIIATLFVAGLSWASETETIASVIAAEACGEGPHGMALVAEVIANRTTAWRKTPYQIVTAKNQFFGYTAGNRARLYKECQVEADRLALKVLAGETGQETGGALYFLLPGERERAWHGAKTITYKAHTFYREAK